MSPTTIAAITGLVTAVTALMAAAGGIYSAARAHGKINAMQDQAPAGGQSSPGPRPDGSR